MARPITTGKFGSQEELVEAIRLYRARGLKDEYIGLKLGVSKSTVRNLRRKFMIDQSR